MRVLHVINSLARGGAEHLLTQLLPALQQQGAAVDLLVLQREGEEYRRKLLARGIRVIASGVPLLHSPLQAVAVASRMAGYDLVHAHLFPTLLWTALAKLPRARPPIVFTEHSTSNRRRGNRLFRTVDAFAYSRFRKVVCVSQGALNSLITHLRWLEDRVVLIYNGIELSQFGSSTPLPAKELPPRPSIGDKTIRRLLCVANLTRAKGHEVLLNCMKQLPEEVHLLLAGAGPLEASLRDLARAQGIQGRVHFLGFRTDVSRLYKSCDVLVLPSLWEGFSLVAVEAMASGLPVVASRVPGLQEVVGQAGLMFAVGDANALAGEIRRLLGSVRLQQQLRRQGLLQAQKFSIERTAAEYAQVYESIKSQSSFSSPA